MRIPLEWWKQREARRRFMPRAKARGTGTTAKFAVVALVVIVAAAALLELRRGTGAESDVIAYAEQNRQDPVDFIEEIARTRHLVVIADIPSAAAPRRFAADAVERLAGTSGLDVVALDVPSDEQPYIDRYLATTPEDASILLARPDAIREGDGASRALLDLYRTVWRVNQDLNPSRRIRIVALDHPDWPPAGAVSPSAAAQLFGLRGPHMMEVIHERVLTRSPQAVVLFLVDGLHALRSGGGRAVTGGTTPVEAVWLGTLLAERYPQGLYTILTDASASRVASPAVATYRGTAAGEALRGTDSGFALRVNETFNSFSRSPLLVTATTGLDFSLQPRAAPVTELADGYAYFGN
ncbi:MAG: hypothetical protein WEF86_14725 [Gemmatimonadota bacterium]